MKKFLVIFSIILTAFALTSCSPSSKANLSVYGDVVSKNGCVLQSRFTVDDRIVFRINVIDPATNKQSENAKVTLHLGTGENLEMKLGLHPAKDPNAPKFWTVGYTVTDKTPTGTLDYYVTAEENDKTGEFRPFNVKPSLITIVSK
ncbi:MAG: hypothetical protein FIA99_14935 [Ruminiclostridium sp.]|nr:hypothetical protein [Ruminiclostridium sp.]